MLDEFYRQPAEWQEHRACWLAWPSHGHLWLDNLERAQREFTDLCLTIAANGGEHLEVLVQDNRAEAQARTALSSIASQVTFHRIPVGDIWLRDTAPIFVQTGRGTSRKVTAACFKFNGWGGKYILPFDNEVSGNIARASHHPILKNNWILEGGSIEVDGEGTGITTRQCLLNPNRNPGLKLGDIEAGLREALGIEKLLWLRDGLLNDHTDGHIDTIARFVGAGHVICMRAEDRNDPNREVLDEIATDLSRFTDATGRKLEVIRIPSPGPVLSSEKDFMPASYVNFYIGNKTVVIPTYGTPYDKKAVEEIGQCFPGRRAVGLSARAILSGGGAFHCITQQEPA